MSASALSEEPGSRFCIYSTGLCQLHVHPGSHPFTALRLYPETSVRLAFVPPEGGGPVSAGRVPAGAGGERGGGRGQPGEGTGGPGLAHCLTRGRGHACAHTRERQLSGLRLLIVIGSVHPTWRLSEHRAMPLSSHWPLAKPSLRGRPLGPCRGLRARG